MKKHLSKKSMVAALGLILILSWALIYFIGCQRDKAIINEYLTSENTVLILEHYDIDNYSKDIPLVYGADSAYFKEALAAVKAVQEQFYPLSEQEREQIIAYLHDIQYRLQWNNERTKRGMSDKADTYWIYLTTFTDKEPFGAGIYVTVSEDMLVSHIEAPEVNRYIGVPKEFLAYLNELFAQSSISTGNEG